MFGMNRPITASCAEIILVKVAHSDAHYFSMHGYLDCGRTLRESIEITITFKTILGVKKIA